MDRINILIQDGLALVGFWLDKIMIYEKLYKYTVSCNSLFEALRGRQMPIDRKP